MTSRGQEDPIRDKIERDAVDEQLLEAEEYEAAMSDQEQAQLDLAWAKGMRPTGWDEDGVTEAASRFVAAWLRSTGGDL